MSWANLLDANRWNLAWRAGRRMAVALAVASAGLCIADLPVPAAAAQSSNTSQGAAAAPAPGSRATTPPSAVPKDSGAPLGYRIGAGDVLQINVWHEPEVSVQGVVVRPDGKVTLPLIKEIDVLGQTPAELEHNLATKLASFVNGADVTVVVREIHSKKVYMVGAVNRVGPIALLSELTVLQALAEAGGISDYAKRKKIYVMRTENGKPNKHTFDYDAVLKGEHMEQNILLHPDDTIVVPH
jgi:polysaccharide export outer membrane protein